MIVSWTNVPSSYGSIGRLLPSFDGVRAGPVLRSPWVGRTRGTFAPAAVTNGMGPA